MMKMIKLVMVVLTAKLKKDGSVVHQGFLKQLLAAPYVVMVYSKDLRSVMTEIHLMMMDAHLFVK